MANRQENTIIVGGSSNPDLTAAICKLSGRSLFPLEIVHFPDGESRAILKADVTGKQAIIVQSLGKKPNDYLVETFLCADALRRGGARKIILACPYLAYSRQNLPETDGASLAARLFAYFLHEVGISSLIALDLHAEHIPSFYDFPVMHLSAKKVLSDKAKKKFHGASEQHVVVGPDLGSAKLVAGYAEEFQTSFALIQKRRLGPRHVESLSLVGEVKEKDVLLADDMCSTAHTLVSAAHICREKGAKKIYASITHGLFVEKALELIEASPIEHLYVTDSCRPDDAVIKSSKVEVVSCAPLFAQAIEVCARAM